MPKSTKSAKPSPKKSVATTRTPLAPLTGPLGPEPRALMNPEDHAAERIALRATPTGGERFALSDTIMAGLGEGGETPLDLATSVLRTIHDECTVLGRVLAEGKGNLEESRLAYAVAARADMAAELAIRMDAARNPIDPQITAPPPAYEVAGALLTLPGVLSATSHRDRLQRIAERLGVAIVVGGPFMEAWAATHGEPRSVYLAGDLGGQRGPAIHIDPREPDHDVTIARWLGVVVAKREGYGHVTDEWRTELAAYLLDHGAKRGAA